MLEDECSVLDIKIAGKLAEKEVGAGSGNFQSFIELVEKMSRVETSIAKLNDEIQFLNNAIHVQILNNPENEMLRRNFIPFVWKSSINNYRIRYFCLNSFAFLIIKSLD